MGISNYKVMSMLSIVVEVRPKVSAVWSFASILVSVSAVLVGALAALKYSVDITPSTLRRWSIEEPHEMGTPWVFDLPFRVQADRLDSLFKYVTTRFRRHLQLRSINADEGEIRFSSEETPDASTRTIDFHYLLGFRSNVGSLPFQLVAKKGTMRTPTLLKSSVRDRMRRLRRRLVFSGWPSSSGVPTRIAVNYYSSSPSSQLSHPSPKKWRHLHQ
jgi:hypothetical protein